MAATNVQKDSWSDEDIATLRRLWAIPRSHRDHMSASQIGRVLDKSGNAVIGKAHRLGLEQDFPRASKSGNFGKQRKLRPQKAATHHGMTAASRSVIKHDANLEKAKQTAKAFKEEIAQYEPEANNVGYLEAQDHQCMWPVGMRGFETIVCGNKKYDNGSLVRPSMYCAHHARAASGGLPTTRLSAGDAQTRRGRPSPRFS